MPDTDLDTDRHLDPPDDCNEPDEDREAGYLDDADRDADIDGCRDDESGDVMTVSIGRAHCPRRM